MILSNSLLAKVSTNEEAQRKVEAFLTCSREATPDSEGHIIDNYINRFIRFKIKNKATWSDFSIQNTALMANTTCTYAACVNKVCYFPTFNNTASKYASIVNSTCKYDTILNTTWSYVTIVSTTCKYDTILHTTWSYVTIVNTTCKYVTIVSTACKHVKIVNVLLRIIKGKG